MSEPKKFAVLLHCPQQQLYLQLSADCWAASFSTIAIFFQTHLQSANNLTINDHYMSVAKATLFASGWSGLTSFPIALRSLKPIKYWCVIRQQVSSRWYCPWQMEWELSNQYIFPSITLFTNLGLTISMPFFAFAMVQPGPPAKIL